MLVKLCTLLFLVLFVCESFGVLIIDGFAFNNEPMAFARMEYLYNHVDWFILSESNVTFQGRERQWPTDQSAHLLAEFGQKIFIERVDVTSHASISWDREEWIRDRIAHRALEEFPAEPFILTVSDGDELPSKEALAELRQRYGELKTRPIDIEMASYYYNFNWVMTGPPPTASPQVWNHAFAVSDLYLKHIARDFKFTAHIRWHREGVRHGVVAGGWHCSSCMSPERILEKAQSFCHANEQPTPTLDWVKYAVSHGKDYLNRKGCCWLERSLQHTLLPHCHGCRTLEEWTKLLPLSDKEPPWDPAFIDGECPVVLRCNLGTQGLGNQLENAVFCLDIAQKLGASVVSEGFQASPGHPNDQSYADIARDVLGFRFLPMSAVGKATSSITIPYENVGRGAAPCGSLAYVDMDRCSRGWCDTQKFYNRLANVEHVLQRTQAPIRCRHDTRTHEGVRVSWHVRNGDRCLHCNNFQYFRNANETLNSVLAGRPYHLSFDLQERMTALESHFPGADVHVGAPLRDTVCRFLTANVLVTDGSSLPPFIAAFVPRSKLVVLEERRKEASEDTSVFTHFLPGSVRMVDGIVSNSSGFLALHAFERNALHGLGV